MKYIKLFDTTANMNAAIANSTVGFLGMADNNGNPVLKNVKVTPGPGPTPPTPSYSTPFYVENITNETEYLYQDTSYASFTVQYSTDTISWNDFEGYLELSPNDKIYLRAETTAWDSYSLFSSSTSISKVGGNIMSLLYGSNFTGDERTFPSETAYNFSSFFKNWEDLVSASELLLPATTLTSRCYQYMFDGCTSLTTAPATLPATTLAESCYYYMFSGCTSLTTAPVLPATTLADSCYIRMFNSCTSLTSAPALPATTLATSCYLDMFKGCTSLTSAPALPATTLAQFCYQGIFSGCTSLTSAPALPATTLANYCYQGMFQDCTSLTTAPALPATTLADGCYSQMFQDCTNLNYIKCLATDISASSCTSNWVNNVAATGTFVKDPNMSSWTTGVNGIPTGWAVEDATE